MLEAAHTNAHEPESDDELGLTIESAVKWAESLLGEPVGVARRGVAEEREADLVRRFAGECKDAVAGETHAEKAANAFKLARAALAASPIPVEADSRDVQLDRIEALDDQVLIELVGYRMTAQQKRKLGQVILAAVEPEEAEDAR